MYVCFSTPGIHQVFCPIFLQLFLAFLKYLRGHWMVNKPAMSLAFEYTDLSFDSDYGTLDVWYRMDQKQIKSTYRPVMENIAPILFTSLNYRFT